MDKETEELMKDLEILGKFIDRVSAKGLDEIKNERIDRMSHLAMSAEVVEVYATLFGITGAMRIAFSLGAAWQREIIEVSNKKTERLLGEINLGE
jgi:hypothetical protein